MAGPCGGSARSAGQQTEINCRHKEWGPILRPHTSVGAKRQEGSLMFSHFRGLAAPAPPAAPAAPAAAAPAAPAAPAAQPTTQTVKITILGVGDVYDFQTGSL